MLEENKYWIIGHSEDFDRIIIGENTGPYSGFLKDSIPVGREEGRMHSIEDYLSQSKQGRISSAVGSVLYKCPYLDDLNQNVQDPEKSFSSPGEVITYIKNFVESMQNILENFSLEGKLPI